MSWKRVCWAHSIGMEKTATDNKRVALKEKQWKNENFEPTSTPHESSLSTTNLALLTALFLFRFLSTCFVSPLDMSLLRALRESSRCGHFACYFRITWRGSGHEHEREKYLNYLFSLKFLRYFTFLSIESVHSRFLCVFLSSGAFARGERN